MKMKVVAQVAPADSAAAESHFADKLAFETDCWDVHYSLEKGLKEMVLLDVRSAECFARGHVEGAVHLPHAKISEEALAPFAADQLFVVYCAGPHCNGADKAALRLARLGRPVKLMIGGAIGWLDEGFDLVEGSA